MTTRINEPKLPVVTSLPNWFNLKNYEKCKDLNYKEWAVQLNYRLILIEELEQDSELDYSMISYGFSKEKLLDNIREFGIANIQEAPSPLHSDEKRRHAKYKVFNSLKSAAIKPISSYMLAIWGESVINKVKNSKNPKDIEAISDTLMGAPYDQFRREHPEKDGVQIPEKAFLMVDLSLPDTEILEQMKVFLPKYKKALNVKTSTKNTTTENINKMVDYETLAFLDLYIWEKIEAVSLKDSTFIGGLYPGFDKGLSELKSCKRHSLKVLNEQFISMLKDKDKKKL